MPSRTLRRSPPRELTLTRSFLSEVKAKIWAKSVSAASAQPLLDHSDTFATTSQHKRRPSYRGSTNPQAKKPTNHHHISSRSVFHRPYHPVHKLPSELLAHIFVLGATAPTHKDDNDDPTFPIRVSHVCSAWRAIALRTPALWRRVVLDKRERMWWEHAYRARACTLDVQLRPYTVTSQGTLHMQELTMHTVQRYMHIMTPHIRRWRTLEVRFAAYAPFLWNAALSGCCSCNNACAPGLEELVLVYPANDDPKEFALFSGFAPRLRRVKLSGIRLTWTPSLFSNLTFLDYAHHGFSRGPHAVVEVLSMLRVSVRLVELRLAFPGARRDAVMECRLMRGSGRATGEESVRLPFLERLILLVDSHDIPAELVRTLALLNMPTVASLQLLDNTHARRPFPHLDAFMRKFAFPTSLRRVYADYGWYDPSSGVLECALRTRVPQLCELSVKRPGAIVQRVDLDVGRDVRSERTRSRWRRDANRPRWV